MSNQEKFIEWFQSWRNPAIDYAESRLYFVAAKAAWQAAYRAGQEDMRERAAQRIALPFSFEAAKAIRALEIKGE